MLFFVLLRLLMIVFLMTQLYPWGILLSLLENLAKENPLAFGFASKSWVLHMCTRRKGEGVCLVHF